MIGARWRRRLDALLPGRIYGESDAEDDGGSPGEEEHERLERLRGVASHLVPGAARRFKNGVYLLVVPRSRRPGQAPPPIQRHPSETMEGGP